MTFKVLQFLVKRLTQLVLVVLVVSLIVFVLTSVLGNPVYLMVRENATPEEIAAVSAYLGLDKPLYVQYWIFVKNVLNGNFGQSYMYHLPALALITERLPATLDIVAVAMVLSIFLGILPVSGRGETGVIFGITTSLATADGWAHIILPSITLALGNVATIIRLTRAGMQENMRQDYVKFARAKGVPNRKVLFGHALKNTLIPVVTVFGLQLGNLIAFTTITETIYAWPGIGKLLIDAVTSADRPIIAAYILFVAVMFVFINFIVDLLYVFIDPRIDLQ